MIQAFGPHFIKLFKTVINSVRSKLVSLLLSVTLTVLTNKRAFYATELITAVKSLMTQALGVCITKLFTTVINAVCSKFVCSLFSVTITVSDKHSSFP